MSSRERVLCALNLKEPDRVPHLELSFDNNIARAILNTEIVNPVKLCKAINLDGYGIGLFNPVFVKVRKASSGREYLTNFLIKTKDDLKRMDFPDPDNEELYVKIEQLIRKLAPENIAIFMASNLGWDGLINSMGLDGFSYALYDSPILISEILDRYTSWTSKVIKHFCELGVDFLWLGDDLAFKNGPMFSPQVFKKIILPRLKKATEKITCPWIFHSDGNILPLMDDLLSLGMNGIHPIESHSMDLQEIKLKYGNRICLCGNIDLNILSLGTSFDVEREVRDKIKIAGIGGGYILTSSHSITNYVKPENVIAMKKAIEQYGKYPIN